MTQKTLKAGKQFRQIAFDQSAINEDARTVDLAFASEEPYERSWGVEILNVDARSMRLGRLQRGAPLLVDHNPSDVVGVIETASVDSDRVARARVRFGRSARAEEIFQDVKDGIRTGVSFGYRIHEMEAIKSDGDVPAYRVTSFEPFELTLTQIPADITVGVGRADDSDEQEITIRGIEPHKEAKMEPQVMQPAAPVIPAAPAAPDFAGERQRVADIMAIAKRWSPDEALVQRAIAEGVPSAVFGRAVLDEIGKRAPVTSPGTPDVGMAPTEVKRYSVLRAIAAAASGNWKAAGLELEAHRAIEAKIGPSRRQGVYVPYEVQKRDLTAAGATTGQRLVATELRPQDFIELLRARTRVAALGARMLTGLVGNVSIPKQTGAGTAYWLATESTAITESDQTIGQITMTPRNIGAYTEISKQLTMQSTPDAEMMVMDDLSRVLAIGIDTAAIAGTGASGQPTGITLTAGIGSVTGTSIAYAGMVEFQTDVAASNALADGCAYLTTPTVAGLLMQRQRFASTDTPLWSGTVLDGQAAGYRATSSTVVPAATMIFGDFSQVVIGEWGVLELEVNPYANFAAGIIGVRAWATVDVAIRQAGAFSVASSIT
jgi:HK97 family phage major capsid protein